MENQRNGSNPESLDLHRICLRSGPGEQSRDGTLFPAVTLTLDPASALESAITSHGNTAIGSVCRTGSNSQSHAGSGHGQFPHDAGFVCPDSFGTPGFQNRQSSDGITPENDTGRNRCKPEEAVTHSTDLTFHCLTFPTVSFPDGSNSRWIRFPAVPMTHGR